MVLQKKIKKKILDYIGSKSLDDLIENTVPENILLKDELKIGHSLSESEALKKLKIISQKNETFRNFIGMGYYNCFTPNVILRNILENPGWYTSTPLSARSCSRKTRNATEFPTINN